MSHDPRLARSTHDGPATEDDEPETGGRGRRPGGVGRHHDRRGASPARRDLADRRGQSLRARVRPYRRPLRGIAEGGFRFMSPSTSYGGHGTIPGILASRAAISLAYDRSRGVLTKNPRHRLAHRLHDAAERGDSRADPPVLLAAEVSTAYLGAGGHLLGGEPTLFPEFPKASTDTTNPGTTAWHCRLRALSARANRESIWRHDRCLLTKARQHTFMLRSGVPYTVWERSEGGSGCARG